jgi:tetratricopeptide (TPR) repeat protein
MKMISKVACAALGLVFVGSSVFAQSLDDARKAIDAEQYQKAKSMLKNLTVTQSTKDENYFYLGWVYLLQEYPDSAKATFMRGIAVNPKSVLNYTGLAVADHLNKDAAGATSNFNIALKEASKHDSRPFLYMGAGYLLLAPAAKQVETADANMALEILNKGKLANPKDADILIQIANADRALKNASEAYSNYAAALALDPKNPAAHVAQGVLISNAQNFEDAEKEFQAALAIDANFGPAYREWAETDLYWATQVRSVASAKVKEAVEHYQKFLSLTDNSTESLLRYALFLYNAGDFTTLQSVAATLSKSANSNALVYRYIGYSAYQNKDYQNGLTAMNTWFTKAVPARIIPSDYLYLGRLQIASGKDTVGGIANLKKASDLDTLQVPIVYTEIVSIYKSKKGDYLDMAKTYEESISKQHGKPLLGDHVLEGIYYYYAFAFNKGTQDSTILVKADSALSYAARIATKPLSDVYVTRARIADLRDSKDLTKMRGIAKPYYEKLIEIFTADPPTDPRNKKNFAEAYAYEGNYYVYHDKDDAKAMDAFTKAQAIDPTNGQAKFYFDQKAAASASPAKSTPVKKSGAK